MMAKLYKKQDKTFSYWEIWNNKDVITIHWGTLGETGFSKEIKVEPPQNLNDIFRKEIDIAKKDGFSSISLDDHYQLIVQFKTHSRLPTPQELNTRIYIENLINHSFGWIGIGHSDGGDNGNGTMNGFGYVIDPEIATKNLLEVLNKNNIDNDVIVASRKGDNLQILYPRNYKGAFNY